MSVKQIYAKGSANRRDLWEWCALNSVNLNKDVIHKTRETFCPFSNHERRDVI